MILNSSFETPDPIRRNAAEAPHDSAIASTVNSSRESVFENTLGADPRTRQAASLGSDLGFTSPFSEALPFVDVQFNSPVRSAATFDSSIAAPPVMPQGNRISQLFDRPDIDLGIRQNTPHLAVILDVLTDPATDPKARQIVSKNLLISGYRLDDPSANQLRNFVLRSDDPEVVHDLLHVLKKHEGQRLPSPSTIGTAAYLLASPNPEISKVAASFIEYLGHFADSALPILFVRSLQASGEDQSNPYSRAFNSITRSSFEAEQLKIRYAQLSRDRGDTFAADIHKILLQIHLDSGAGRTHNLALLCNDRSVRTHHLRILPSLAYELGRMHTYSDSDCIVLFQLIGKVGAEVPGVGQLILAAIEHQSESRRIEPKINLQAGLAAFSVEPSSGEVKIETLRSIVAATRGVRKIDAICNIGTTLRDTRSPLVAETLSTLLLEQAMNERAELRHRASALEQLPKMPSTFADRSRIVGKLASYIASDHFEGRIQTAACAVLAKIAGPEERPVAVQALLYAINSPDPLISLAASRALNDTKRFSLEEDIVAPIVRTLAGDDAALALSTLNSLAGLIENESVRPTPNLVFELRSAIALFRLRMQNRFVGEQSVELAETSARIMNRWGNHLTLLRSEGSHLEGPHAD